MTAPFVTISTVALLVSSFTVQALGVERPGEIDGKVAIMVVPTVVDRNGDTQKLPTGNCTVHLVETEEQTTQTIFPCGVWFQPPVARYLFWLEQESSISHQTVISYAGEPFTDSGLMLSKTMYPAGSVALKSGTHVPDQGSFRLISLERVENFRPFDRRIASSHVCSSVRMPVGPVIAGVFDRYGQAVSLSRPQEVAAGKTTVVQPEAPPRGRSSVVAVLTRSGFPGPVPCEIELATGKQIIPPLVNFQTQERVVAAWYDLEAPETASLRIRCGDTQPLERLLRLAPRSIQTVRANLLRPLLPIQPPK